MTNKKNEDCPRPIEAAWHAYEMLAKKLYEAMEALSAGEEVGWDDLECHDRHFYTSCIAKLFEDVSDIRRALEITDHSMISRGTGSCE